MRRFGMMRCTRAIHGLRVCGDASTLVQHVVVLEHVALRAVLQHDVWLSHTPYSMLSASARRASGLVPSLLQ